MSNPTKRPTIAVHALGDFQTNCYVITPPGEKTDIPCVVIDCGFHPEPLLSDLEARTLTPEAVVLTHAHADHIAGLSAFRARFPTVPIWIHRDEELWLTDAERNLSAAIGQPITAPPADRLLDEGYELSLLGSTWRVLHTPGHSPGSISLVHADSPTCFAGDALFNGSIGRTDFPGCSFEDLEASIQTKLYPLDNETLVLPGHGPPTTIGDEKVNNPFVRPRKG